MSHKLIPILFKFHEEKSCKPQSDVISAGGVRKIGTRDIWDTRLAVNDTPWVFSHYNESIKIKSNF